MLTASGVPWRAIEVTAAAVYFSLRNISSTQSKGVEEREVLLLITRRQEKVNKLPGRESVQTCQMKMFL